MIPRNLKAKLLQLAGKFPAISLTGPRQSGKTTLIREAFPNLPYVSLEDPDNREIAETDPKGFLNSFPEGAILDELQKVPELFSYLQSYIDDEKDRLYILSGSQNFLMSENISQSLAGRVAILKLLPLSMAEIENEGLELEEFEKVAYTGFYPRIFHQGISPADFYPNYIQTYVERDVRQLTQVHDLNTFSIFLKLCAGRAGNLLNLSGLANDTGVSVNTVKSWINLLEASYIVFRLYPYHQNFNKRLIKMPKLYFLDTGLLCYLLNIREPSQLETHFARGGVFENLIILELLKNRYNKGLEGNFYFWRDHKGREVDLIIDDPDGPIPVEMKSGRTYSMDFFKGLTYWNKLSGQDPKDSYVVYAGEKQMNLSEGNLVSWKKNFAEWK